MVDNREQKQIAAQATNELIEVAHSELVHLADAGAAPLANGAPGIQVAGLNAPVLEEEEVLALSQQEVVALLDPQPIEGGLGEQIILAQATGGAPAPAAAAGASAEAGTAAMSTAQMVGLGAVGLGVIAAASGSSSSSPAPAPAPEPQTLTLAEALGLATLPAAYTITADPVDAGPVSVADANAAYAQVASILAGATGDAPALADVFQWQIRDGARNIIRNLEQDSVRGAGRVALTDESITSDELGTLRTLLGDAFDLGTTTISSGEYVLRALPNQVSLIEGVDLNLVDLTNAAALDPALLITMGQAPILTPTERNTGVQGAAGNPGEGDDLVLATSASLAGAIIDLGAGRDTLYVDVNGNTAAALVQNVEVVELNNIAAPPAAPSLVNLSTVLGIESLVITEAINATNALQVVGVRNNAEVTLRGSFNLNTSVNFLNSGELNLVLDDYFQNTGQLQIALDGSVLNLTSTGEGVLNAIDTGAFGAPATTNLVQLNLSGDVDLALTGAPGPANGMQFRAATQAQIDATAFEGDVLTLVVAPHRNISFAGGAADDNLTVTGAVNNLGDTVLTLNAAMGAGDNMLTLQGPGAATTITAGSVLSAEGGSLEVVIAGAGNIDMTRVDVGNVDTVVFAAGNNLILNAAQVNTIGSGNFSNNVGVTNGGLLVRDLGDEVLDLSDLRVGTIVTVRTAPGDVVLNADTVLGNANAGVSTLQIHTAGTDSTLTMTAQQFAQLNGTGIVVRTGGTNNPVTGQPFEASLVITDVAADQAFDFGGVNLNGGITVQLTDGFVADGLEIQNAGPSEVTLEISGAVDLRDLGPFGIDNVIMAAGSELTLDAAQVDAARVQSISGEGNFTLNVVGSPVNLGLTEDVDLPGLTIIFVNEGAPSAAVFNVGGPHDFTIKGITTGEGVTGLTINNTLGGEFTLTGGSPAITLDQSTTTLTIDALNDMVFGGEGNPGITAPGLTTLTVNGAGDVDLGTIADVADTFTLNAFGALGTVTATLAESAPANAIWTFSNVTLTIAEGVEFGAGSQLVLDNVVLSSEVDLATLPISSASQIALDASNTPAEITALLGKLAGATASADVTGMDSAQLAAIANAITKIAPLGLEGDLAIDSDLTAVQIGAIYGRYDQGVAPDQSTSRVNAEGMTVAQLQAIVPGSVSAAGISNLTVTEELLAGEIGALLGKAQNATVNATDMGAGQLNAVAGAIDNVAVIENLTLVAGLAPDIISADNITKLFLKTEADSVTVDAAGMSPGQLSAVVLDIAKVSTIENLTIAAGTSVAEMEVLLSKAEGAEVNANLMDSEQLATVAANADQIASISKLVINAELPADDITALLGITQDEPEVVLTDLSDEQFAAIVPQVANITISGDTTAARLQELDAALTPTLDADGVGEISGTIEEITALFAAQTAGSIEGLLNNDLVITDSGTIEATDVFAVVGLVDDLTVGSVAVANATTITGTAAELLAATAAAWESDPDVTVTDPADDGEEPPVSTIISFSTLSDIDDATNGVVTVENAVTITGIGFDDRGSLLDGSIVAATANLVVDDFPSIINDTTRLQAAQLTESTEGTVTLKGAPAADAFNLTGYTGGDLIINAEDVGAAVTFTATAGAHTLTGGDEDDTFNISGGTQTLDGGAGNDVFTITGGNHTLTGGLGSDTFTLSAGPQVITDLGVDDVLVTTGSVVVTAATDGFTATADTYNTSSGTVTLNAGADGAEIDMSLAGTGAGDLEGDAGYTINGGAGADTLTGSQFADVISGGAGNDVIRGGAGNDTINISGGGQNRIVFEEDAETNGVDTITGFQAGGAPATSDILDFSLFGVAGDINETVTAATAGGDPSEALAAGGIFVVNLGATAIAGFDFGEAQFGNIFGAENNFLGVELNGKAVVVVQGSDRSEVYFVDSAGPDNVVAADVTLVAVLSDVTNTAVFGDQNFSNPI